MEMKMITKTINARSFYENNNSYKKPRDVGLRRRD